MHRLELYRPVVVRLPKGPPASIELTVFIDDSVVGRPRKKKQRYHALISDNATANNSIGYFVIEVSLLFSKAVDQIAQASQEMGFDVELSKLQRAAVIESIETVMKIIRRLW